MEINNKKYKSNTSSASGKVYQHNLWSIDYKAIICQNIFEKLFETIGNTKYESKFIYNLKLMGE